MRCEPLDGNRSAEESVEPIPGQAEFLSGRLRLCTRKTQSRHDPRPNLEWSRDAEVFRTDVLQRFVGRPRAAERGQRGSVLTIAGFDPCLGQATSLDL
jgi:hypothetical protein